MIGLLPRETPSAAPPQVTNRDYLSFSAISTYQLCPQKFYFRYVAGLPEETVSASLVFGSAIHRAVELHFNELLADNPPPELNALLAEYHAGWSERNGANVQFGKGDDVATLATLAERMLATFQTSDFAQHTGRVIGVEEEFRGAIVSGCPDLLGRVDLLIETDDALHVIDFKTARSRWTTQQANNSAEQLLLYSELVRDVLPGKTLRLQFAVLTKAKTPSLDLLDVAHAPQRLARTKRIIEHVWHAIQAQHFYPSPSAMQCPGCPFQRACRAWEG